jgi:hypothetical protein
VRELAQRRDTSVSKVIIDALGAELLADEIAGGSSSNGRPMIGGGWSPPAIAMPPPPMWSTSGSALPMHERGVRVEEVRRYLGTYRLR